MLILIGPTTQPGVWAAASLSSIPASLQLPSIYGLDEVTSKIGAPLKLAQVQAATSSSANNKQQPEESINNNPSIDQCASIADQDRMQQAVCKQQQRSDSVLSNSTGTGTDTDDSNRLYKTELCRSWLEKQQCNYGDRCQYAHGSMDLRTVPRHPKYKTDLCRKYHTLGYCSYGPRCHFVHDNHEQQRAQAEPAKNGSLVGSANPQFAQPLSVNTGLVSQHNLAAQALLNGNTQQLMSLLAQMTNPNGTNPLAQGQQGQGQLSEQQMAHMLNCLPVLMPAPHVVNANRGRAPMGQSAQAQQQQQHFGNNHSQHSSMMIYPMSLTQTQPPGNNNPPQTQPQQQAPVNSLLSRPPPPMSLPSLSMRPPVGGPPQQCDSPPNSTQSSSPSLDPRQTGAQTHAHGHGQWLGSDGSTGTCSDLEHSPTSSYCSPVQPITMEDLYAKTPSFDTVASLLRDLTVNSCRDPKQDAGQSALGMKNTTLNYQGQSHEPARLPVFARLSNQSN